MAYIEISKLVVDVLLMLSLMYAAWRFSKTENTSHSSRTSHLEESLRSLIKEAEESSRNLGDDLLRRQQSMEKVLREIEAAEGRIQRSLKGVDDKKLELEEEIHKAALILKQRAASTTSKPQPIEPEPEVFVESHYVQEPEIVPTSIARRPARSLAQEIEREVYESAFEEPLQNVISQAEQVSAIGRQAQQFTSSIDSSSDQSKDKFQSMRSAVERWEASVGRSASEEKKKSGSDEGLDPRLGVLGAMRRQSPTL